MIEQQTNNTIKSQGTTSTNFNIETNGSMMKMITSKVYNDPITAVMREWSTNAIDACIAADKDINFDVDIPTPSKPAFSVRDYGTGLSKEFIAGYTKETIDDEGNTVVEEVPGLFSTLGASTKRDSNVYNGTFGIGRMAGLAYTSSFTVESFYEGMHYTFVVAENGDIPSIILLGEVPTEEPNGLRLSIAVDFSDITYFRQKAEFLYRYFSYKPNLNTELSIERDASNDISDNWFHDEYLKSYRNYVLMSNVLYVIPEDARIRSYGCTNYIIKVPTGKVSINPGRESLNLDKSSIEYINKKFKEIKQDYIENLEEHIEEQETEINKITAFSKAFIAAPTQVRREMDLRNYITDKTKSLFTSVYGGPMLANTGKFEQYYDKVAMRYKASMNVKAQAIENEYKMPNTLYTTPILIIDLKTNYSSAIRKQDSCIVLARKSTKIDINDFIEQAKELLSDLGINEYLLASEHVDKKEVIEKTSRKGIYVCPSSTHGFRLTKSEKVKEDCNYWYIPCKGTTPEIEEDISFVQLKHLYNALPKENRPELVGVQKKYRKAVKENKNFSPAVPAILEAIKKQSFIVTSSQVKHFHRERLRNVNVNPPEIKELIRIYDYYQENWEKERLNRDILNTFDIPYEFIDFPTSLKDIYKKYPLLDYFLNQSYRATSTQIGHYLDLEYNYATLRNN